MKCLNVFSAGLIFSLIFARLGLAQVDDASLVKTIQTLAASREPAKMISAVVMTQSFVDTTLTHCPVNEQNIAKAWQKRNGIILSQIVARLKQDRNKATLIQKLEQSVNNQLNSGRTKACQSFASMISNPGLDLVKNRTTAAVHLAIESGYTGLYVAPPKDVARQGYWVERSTAKGYDIVSMNKHVESGGMEWNGSGWSQSFKVRIFALYANGEYWVNPDVAPQHLNPVKAKQAHPKQWGSWRKSGNQIWITDHKGKQEKLPGFRIAPIRVGTKLHGAWYNENVGSVAIGSSSGYWSASKTIRFNSAGRFDTTKRQTTASTTTSSGSQTGTYGNRNQPTQTGRYQFNGYTVNLNYDNGQSEWLLSYAIDKDNDPYNRIMINDREYTHQ